MQAHLVVVRLTGQILVAASSLHANTCRPLHAGQALRSSHDLRLSFSIVSTLWLNQVFVIAQQTLDYHVSKIPALDRESSITSTGPKTQDNWACLVDNEISLDPCRNRLGFSTQSA